MENPSTKKWYQKPITVILFLIIFFPVGLYLMWSNKMWSKTTRIIISVLLGLFVFYNLSNSKSNLTESSNYKVSKTINGTYVYSDSSIRIEITIRGNNWSGKTMIVSGFGSGYDSQNTEYESGYVKGNDLYDSSGFVKIGRVSDRSLTSSIGGRRVTLRKK